MEFYEKHKADRDKFEILAFHDTRAKTFDEYDQKIAKTVKTRWKGKRLPFPIILDATGATIKRYGITYYPTVLLIDPDGNIVGEDRPAKLLEAGIAALKKAQPGVETTKPSKDDK